MIPKMPFGRTAHDSTRIIFGAAALFAVDQDAADRVLDELLEAGINHIDVAASYGDAELRVGPWMREHRNDFFLASKECEYPEPFGDGLVVRLVPGPGLVDRAMRLMRELGYWGICDIEFKRDPRDLEYKVLDANPHVVRAKFDDIIRDKVGRGEVSYESRREVPMWT